MAGIPPGAVLATEVFLADALIVPQGVITPAMLTRGGHRALINVVLALRPGEPGPITVAEVVINLVCALALVLTRSTRTVINVVFTELAKESRLANTICTLQKHGNIRFNFA